MGRYEKKFGKARAEKMIPAMQQTARQVGIKMEYGGLVGNTRNSHRLIARGEKDPALQNTVVEALFHAYFEANDDISSVDTLAHIAAETKLFGTEQEAKEFLMDETEARQVDAEVQHAYERGISGVPHFTIDNKYSVSGAQEAPVFKHIFETIMKDQGGVKVVGPGEQC